MSALVKAQDALDAATVAYERAIAARNAEVVRARGEGRPVTHIAEEMGLSRQTVHDILKRA